jgi:hypothetical protein
LHWITRCHNRRVGISGNCLFVSQSSQSLYQNIASPRMPLPNIGDVSPLGEAIAGSHDGRNVLDARSHWFMDGKPTPASKAHSFVEDTRAATPLIPPLIPPNLPFGPQRDSIASSFLNPTESMTSLHQSGSSNRLNPSKSNAADFQYTGEDRYGQNYVEKSVKRSPRSRLLLFLAGLLAFVVAIVLGVYFGVVHRSKPRNNTASVPGPGHTSAASPSASATPGKPASSIVYGGDGTVVTTEQGSTFTYNNSFGGYFVYDSGNPFNNDARAQSWSPPLNQSWQFGKDQVLG